MVGWDREYQLSIYLAAAVAHTAEGREGTGYLCCFFTKKKQKARLGETNLEQQDERDLNFANQSLLALEPRSSSLLQKRHLVCGQRTADKEKGKKDLQKRVGIASVQKQWAVSSTACELSLLARTRLSRSSPCAMNRA